jgi:hypothetical protein
MKPSASWLLDEVQDVLLRLLREAALLLPGLLARRLRQRAPHVVDLLLQIGLAVLAPQFLLHQRQLLRPAIAVDPVMHQRMAAVEDLLHRVQPMTLLALRDVGLGIDQVIDDRAGIRPHPEQVVALEERVVAETGVGHHQRLHRHGVFFHQVGDARIGIDHDLVRQPHVAAPVVLLAGDELLAERPVPVVHRHADRRIGIEHLLGGNQLELDRVGVEPETLRGLLDGFEIGFDQLEGPVGRIGQALVANDCGLAHLASLRLMPWRGSWTS